MKYILLPLILVLSFSCCGKKIKTTQPMSYNLESDCPTDGTCKITIYPNEKLEIVTDKTGAIYYKKIADNNSTIFHFQYTRTAEEGVQDGQYQEEVLFEYSNANLPLHITDQSLQSTKMLFGRHCFCKGQAGYFVVKSGSLNLNQSKAKTTLDLQFQIAEVPQIIRQLQGNWH